MAEHVPTVVGWDDTKERLTRSQLVDFIERLREDEDIAHNIDVWIDRLLNPDFDRWVGEREIFDAGYNDMRWTIQPIDSRPDVAVWVSLMGVNLDATVHRVVTTSRFGGYDQKLYPPESTGDDYEVYGFLDDPTADGPDLAAVAELGRAAWDRFLDFAMADAAAEIVAIATESRMRPMLCRCGRRLKRNGVTVHHRTCHERTAIDVHRTSPFALTLDVKPAWQVVWDARPDLFWAWVSAAVTLQTPAAAYRSCTLTCSLETKPTEAWLEPTRTLTIQVADWSDEWMKYADAGDHGRETTDA